jgi:hypothetical protein
VAHKRFCSTAHLSGRRIYNLEFGMRFAMCIGLVVLAAPSLVAPRVPPASKPTDSVTEFQSAGSLAMQADMKSALPHLLRVRPDALPEKQRTVWSCMRERFVARKPVVTAGLDPWTADVLRIYRNYWTRVMLGEVSAQQGDRELAAALAAKVKHGEHADMNALEPLLQAQIEARGYHALFGVTKPLREFMLWRKQSDETYDIELPEGRREAVHVTMMDDFVSLGWLGYAVCDYHHTGGWATPERLFAVRSAYALDSEDFRVSYLAHEGQHFADYRRFPGLAQADLEYRAKLVEIANARTSLYDLLAAFGTNESESREQPHPWANRQVVNRLAAKLLDGQAPSVDAWKRVPAEKINAAAAELLAQDSRERAAALGRLSRDQ